jgi:uncharacterized peroxidase-related enzyme
MPRLAAIDPKNAEGRAKELFEGPLKGKTFNMFKTMASAPAALQAYLSMAGALQEGMLTAAEREAIALAVGEANRCEYCVSAHTLMGKKAGLTDEQTVGARRGQLADAKLNALTHFVRTLSERRGLVDDATVNAMRSAGYTDGHIAEAIANVALNLYTNYFNHVNATDVDFPKVPLLG